MTTVLVDVDISGRVPPGTRDLSDFALSKCRFNNCYVPPPDDVGQRLRLSQIRLKSSTHWSCAIEAAILEDVVIDGLKRAGPDPLFLRCCAFNRVTLRGAVSFILPKAEVRDHGNYRVLPALWRDNERIYAQCDWALDITEARFGGLVTFPGIPVHLVRRNPATQFVFNASAAPAIVSSQAGTVWAIIAQNLMDLGSQGVVVAIGTRSKTFSRDIASLKDLQDQGLAE